MLPFTLAVPQAIYTRPETQLSYTTPECRTSECTWKRFTSLAICLEMNSMRFRDLKLNCWLI